MFDEFQPKASQYSPNNMFLKGCKNINELVETLIRWKTHQVTIHIDVRKMCNTVKGNDKYCCFQRYMFDKHLDQEKISQEKIIKILT